MVNKLKFKNEKDGKERGSGKDFYDAQFNADTQKTNFQKVVYIFIYCIIYIFFEFRITQAFWSCCLMICECDNNFGQSTDHEDPMNQFDINYKNRGGYNYQNRGRDGERGFNLLVSFP